MAGIGFELRRLLAKNNYSGILSAYIYAGTITSGPWLLSVLSILLLSMIATMSNVEIGQIRSFQAIVVYLIAGSLIFSAIFQHSYVRYIADELFLKHRQEIITSLNSIFLFILFFGGIIGFLCIQLLLPHQTFSLKFITLSCFILLSLIWVTTCLLSGLLIFRTIFLAFVINFAISLIVGWYLRKYGLEGLLFSYLCGQIFLFLVMVYQIYHCYATDEIINYHFFKMHQTRKILIFTGLFYNLGIWIDKFIFWYHPATGTPIIEKLHGSVIYDTPIFIAYLAVIPSMIIFLLHIETDYASAYENLYKKILGDNTLSEIRHGYSELVQAGRASLFSIIKSTSYILLMTVTIGAFILPWFNITTVYLPLFCICIVATSLNVIFWGTLDIIFYLDKPNHAIFLTNFFLITNALFTWISIELGIFYFGYGLLFSLLLTVICSFLLINKEFQRLQYETYMLD